MPIKSTSVRGDAQTEALRRRQMIGDALAQQSLQGAPADWDRMPVTPAYGLGQGLLDVGGAFLGGKIERDASKELSGLEDQKRKAYADSLRGLVQQPIQPGQPGSGVLRPGQPAPLSGQQEAAIGAVGQLPVEQQAQMIGAAGASKLFPGKGATTEVSAGGALVDPLTGKEIYRNPAAAGRSPQYGNPQIGPDGSILVLDRASGEYIDTGKKASANQRLVTAPDGSVISVDMRQPSQNGAPATAPVISPETALAGRRNAAQATELGKTTAENQAGLPDALADLDKMRADIDNLTSDPGFSTIYGLSGKLDPTNYVPGTAAANAIAKRNTLSAESFGIVIQKMRGLGSLSNAEGARVTDAFSRATNPSLSDEEAKLAWDEVRLYLDKAEERARAKAGGQFGGAPAQPPGAAPPPAAGPEQPPPGVDPQLWQFLSPEERALWR